MPRVAFRKRIQPSNLCIKIKNGIHKKEEQGEIANLQLADLIFIHWIFHTDQLKFEGKIAKHR